MGQYPLSKKLRFEGGISATRYSFRVDSINNYYLGNVRIDRNSQQIDAPESFNLYRGYLAYAADNSMFGLTSPMRGYRYRIQAERTFGEIAYWGFLNDYRKYFFFSPSSIGLRIMHYGRYGQSANELHPMFLGYEYYVRGYSYRSMSRQECRAENCLSVNNLQGSKMLIANAEFRYPFIGPKRLAPIKSRTFFTDLVVFADGGLSWYDFNNIAFRWEPEEQSEKHIPVFSAGSAIRLNLLGAIVVNLYYAYPFQRSASKTSGVLGFYIGAGF
jgi:outer membrane protein assembly factor BamA